MSSSTWEEGKLVKGWYELFFKCLVKFITKSMYSSEFSIFTHSQSMMIFLELEISIFLQNYYS